jgi:hypothetical protein
MSIFVDPSKRFELKLNFDEIKTENGDIVCYKFHDDGLCTVSCDVKARNFADMSHIIEEATIINSVTGNPLLRTSVLCKLVVATFFSSIKLIIRSQEVDEKGKTTTSEKEEVFYPDKNSVNNMRYELVKILTKKWLELTGGK